MLGKTVVFPVQLMVLQAKYGEDRVFDTPLAESGIGGFVDWVGVTGWRPIPEIPVFPVRFETMDSVVVRCHGCVTGWAALAQCRSRFGRLLAVVFTPGNAQ